MPVNPGKPVLIDIFDEAVAAQGCAQGKGRIGLAVSGGGDSLALMHMAARLIAPQRLLVASVDHGLREGAKAEIALAAQQATDLCLPHRTLRWQWDRKGNLQAAARVGRWAKLVDWAHRNDIRTVFLGHTQDDQVETLLMRLARGSGVDGLTAMARADFRDGLRVVRPLLDISRADLRDWLRAEGIAWSDDPSNDDPNFDRVRARKMFAQLETLGLTRKRVLQTIDHMQAAHRSLQKAAHAFARTYLRQDTGDLIFAPDALKLEKEDAPRRVMAAAIQWIGGHQYRPRFEKMLEAVAQVASGRAVTLGGCFLIPVPGGGMRMGREAAATAPPEEATRRSEDSGVMWDRRWFVDGPLRAGLTIRALGDDVRQCPDWRAVDLPRTSLMASPSVWDGQELLAAPVAGHGRGWTAQIVADFHEHAFAH